MPDTKKPGSDTPMWLAIFVPIITAGYFLLSQIETDPRRFPDTTSELVTVHGIVTSNPGWGPPDSPSFLSISLPDGKELAVMYANINGFALAGELCDPNINIADFAMSLKVGTKVAVHGRWQIAQSELQRGVRVEGPTICTASDESITIEK